MPKILVVEDELEQLNLRRQMLELAGYEVSSARTAAEALPQVAGCQVVLMDLRLPKAEDGMELIQAASGRARIIVLSGAEPDTSLPVDEFLAKPCSSKKVLAAVARLCGPEGAG